MSLKQDSQLAHQLYQQIVSDCQLDRVSDLLLARQLYNIKQDKLYRKATGEGGITRWVDFISQPEINISQHKSRKLLRIYEHFVVGLGYQIEELLGIDTNALDYIAKNGVTEDIDELLEGARTLTYSDFKDRVHDQASQGERTYTYLVMQRCEQTNNLKKVHGISSEDILDNYNIDEQSARATDI